MNFIFPLVYSSILFIVLLFLCFYFFGQLKTTQKVEKRLSYLETKLQKNERSSENFYKLGQLYLSKKIYEKAISLFRSSLNVWDKNDKIGLGSLYNTLGFSYFKLKQYNHAIYYYNQAIKLLPDYALALTNLALVYEKKQMYKEAYFTYLKAFSFEKRNKLIQSRLSVLKLKLQLKS